MKAAEAMIAYTPKAGPWSGHATAGQIRITHVSNKKPGWSGELTQTVGATSARRRELEGWQQVAMTFIEFNTMVVRDGMDPQVVHDAFLAIDEYRHTISPDMRGAEREDGSKPGLLG